MSNGEAVQLCQCSPSNLSLRKFVFQYELSNLGSLITVFLLNNHPSACPVPVARGCLQPEKYGIGPRTFSSGSFGQIFFQAQFVAMGRADENKRSDLMEHFVIFPTRFVDKMQMYQHQN